MAPDPDDVWRRQGACRGTSPALFYPPDEHPDGKPRRETMKMYAEPRVVCAGCEVSAQCLEHALKNNETDGMWGGKTPVERAKILSERRRARRSA